MSEDDLRPVPEAIDATQIALDFVEGQKVFDRYILKQMRGRGGMGVVWQAWDEELERDVALKLLPELITRDKEAIADLKRETRRSLELTHPHIVRIYDFIQSQNCAAISMEYVDGDTLSARKSAQPKRCFEVRELTPWVQQLCSALTYAHEEAKVVHRDLKPSNMMVDSKNRIKVADFGIARSLSDSVSRITIQRNTSGTLVYMSPQQALGKPATILDDVYTIGATLFDLLAGKPPFYTGEVYQQLLHADAVSVAKRRLDLGIEGEVIPREWESTISACLSKNPGGRPQSVAEVAKRLGIGTSPQKSGGGNQKKQDSGTYETSKGKKTALSVLLGACLLIILVFIFYIQKPAAENAERVAQQRKQEEARSKTEQEVVAAEKLRTEQEKTKAEQEKIKAEQIRLANAKGDLLLKTKPAGATVTLGTEVAQTSPASFKGIHIGKYPLKIQLDGFEPVEREVEIKENDANDLGAIELQRSTGGVTITSEPASDYEIKSDDLGISRSGKTPDSIKELPVGTYTITYKCGTLEIKDTLDIKRNDTVTKSAAFAAGSVSITSEPAGARVIQNGKEIGKTPFLIENVPTGELACQLRLKGYKAANVKTEVVARQRTSLGATLEKIKGQGPDAGENFINSIGMKLNWVSPINAWVGVYEVTQEEYQKVMGENPSKFKSPRHPVEMVNWNEAVTFCQKLTERDRAAGTLSEDFKYSLPTDEQWSLLTGNASLDDAVTCAGGRRRNGTEYVGSRDANEFGLYDTRGNVSEWCLDWYDEAIRTKDSSPVSPEGGLKYKVLRGGSWVSSAPETLELNRRFNTMPTLRLSSCGFRVVLLVH